MTPLRFLADLRKYGSLVGLTNNFVIADRDASLSIIKRLKPASLDEFKADLKPAKLLELISSCKSKNMSPGMYRRTAARAKGNEAASRIDAVADVYKLYQDELEGIQAVDFDDILLYGWGASVSPAVAISVMLTRLVVAQAQTRYEPSEGRSQRQECLDRRVPGHQCDAVRDRQAVRRTKSITHNRRRS